MAPPWRNWNNSGESHSDGTKDTNSHSLFSRVQDPGPQILASDGLVYLSLLLLHNKWDKTRLHQRVKEVAQEVTSCKNTHQKPCSLLSKCDVLLGLVSPVWSLWTGQFQEKLLTLCSIGKALPGIVQLAIFAAVGNIPDNHLRVNTWRLCLIQIPWLFLNRRRVSFALGPSRKCTLVTN